MRRTLPLARDIKTVAIVRAATPAKHPLAFLASFAALHPRKKRPLFPGTLGTPETPETPEPTRDEAHDTEIDAPRTAARAPSTFPSAYPSAYRSGAVIAGKYRLMRQLGRGGMGEVWSAEHLALNTEVAVKFLSTHAPGDAAKITLDRFRFEAQVSAHLALATNHVVSVHDAGSDAVGPYLVMEYVRGRTLRAELNQRGRLAPEVVLSLLAQLAEALAVAHGCGIVHRDLKPSNLLLGEPQGGEFCVKVADFGIAKALRDDLAVDRPEDTSEGFRLGSPAYMSPEQQRGDAVDARTDLWAVGVITYEALTGRLPFPGRSVSEIFVSATRGRFPPPSTSCPWLPVALDDWFLRALARKKEQRFPSMEEMARAFQLAITPRVARRWPRTLRGVAMASGLLAVAVALQPAPFEARPEPALDALPTAATALDVLPTALPTVATPGLADAPRRADAAPRPPAEAPEAPVRPTIIQVGGRLSPRLSPQTPGPAPLTPPLTPPLTQNRPPRRPLPEAF